MEAILLKDDGVFCNNPVLPLLIYPVAFLPFGDDPAGEVERRFDENCWPAAWRNGVYNVHHYHSKAHAALGVYRGVADAAVLPAGTVHKLIDASSDFALVGAYPPDQHPDMCYGRPGERPGADERIAQVPVPEHDPVVGKSGKWQMTSPTCL